MMLLYYFFTLSLLDSFFLDSVIVTSKALMDDTAFPQTKEVLLCHLRFSLRPVNLSASFDVSASCLAGEIISHHLRRDLAPGTLEGVPTWP